VDFVLHGHATRHFRAGEGAHPLIEQLLTPARHNAIVEVMRRQFDIRAQNEEESVFRAAVLEARVTGGARLVRTERACSRRSGTRLSTT
jgi:hypothetical protein